MGTGCESCGWRPGSPPGHRYALGVREGEVHLSPHRTNSGLWLLCTFGKSGLMRFCLQLPREKTVVSPRAGGAGLPPRAPCLAPHQVGRYASPNEEACVDVHRVAAVLCDLGEAADACRNGEGEHQDGLQQLGGVRDDRVEVHLPGDRWVVRAVGPCGASGVRGSTHRHVDSSKGRQSGMLGWEGLPARNTQVSPEALGPALVSPHACWDRARGAHRADRMAWVSWPEHMSCVM